MSIRIRLTIMNFLQFFIFGSWLMTFSAYAFKVLHFSGTQIGAIYSTLGIASFFMPALTGALADRRVNAERVFAASHVLGAVALFFMAFTVNATAMFWFMLVYSMLYMPTIPLAGAICFRIFSDHGQNIAKTYPPIRVWGTVGFIAALWLVSWCGLELSVKQLFIAASASFCLGVFAWFLPACTPMRDHASKSSIFALLGLNALTLCKNPQMAIFFVLSILVGVALQINNTFVSGFLHDFDLIPRFRDAFGVTHSAIIMSLAQMSETLFILAIPFFLTRFGIKKVMLISIFAWVLRFGLLAYGDPSERIWLILLSMAIYGCAFDFFNISCAIFVDNETPAEMRAGAQGLFFIMTLGIGAFCGSYGGGIIVDALSSLHAGVMVRHWSQIWMVFAAYMLVVGIIVILFFKPKTKNVNSQQITH